MRGDRGSVSFIVAVTGLGTFMVAAVTLPTIDRAITDRHRAQVAADMGVLAGAPYAIDGQATACAVAADIVGRNGATMVDCHVVVLDLLVTAEVRARRESARAGPLRTG